MAFALVVLALLVVLADFVVLLVELDFVDFLAVVLAEYAEDPFVGFTAFAVFDLEDEVFEEVPGLAVFLAAVLVDAFLEPLAVGSFATFADFALVVFEAVLDDFALVAFEAVFAEDAFVLDLFEVADFVVVVFFVAEEAFVFAGFLAVVFLVAEVVFFVFDVDAVFDVESAFFEVGTSNPFDGA